MEVGAAGVGGAGRDKGKEKGEDKGEDREKTETRVDIEERIVSSKVATTVWVTSVKCGCSWLTR